MLLINLKRDPSKCENYYDINLQAYSIAETRNDFATYIQGT